MHPLNFPSYKFRIKNSQNRQYIFDGIRKKFVVLQPEEWVRQHVLHFLIFTKNYPKSLVNVEKQLTVNKLKKRYDIVVFNSDGSIFLLVECKAPEAQIDQTTFDQIARYNYELDAQYLMVTNGLNHYYCEMDQQLENYRFLKEIPDFSR
ncbi:type I restriction enzyme HsdR N-terminal domain-containing protein [Flagellimonas zhangzhouensis]|uniref:Type I restriction enzyme R protein N terminus (HSDR_N) n=1 Tax=Flagellimonas zhangzhouensis TaxID=1073328 RepID=A0A1H2SBE4_9FLAO|nr:type I restriction enzyme HsdR N-terminal domain-containing protein [Allomuricauda zhangzhouensis]SDQ72975.1 Type I restriction enzyme R protein N terminus (HSDR_N) [Allomuricauda zhangzhouensis]SDW28946.1 Type I restriction enzyme R protein N terminus (HSDR_N) [Allomuricauda zhangzhouensis]